jgi:hypothetical protein
LIFLAMMWGVSSCRLMGARWTARTLWKPDCSLQWVDCKWQFVNRGTFVIFRTSIGFSVGPTTVVFCGLMEYVCYNETGHFTFATLMMVLYFIDQYSLRTKKMSFSFPEKLNIFNIIYIYIYNININIYIYYMARRAYFSTASSSHHPSMCSCSPHGHHKMSLNRTERCRVSLRDI